MKPLVLRGKVLEFLRNIYPEGADERTILGIFYEYHIYDDIVAAAFYLADKGYAKLTEVPHPYKPVEKIRMYKITPAGIDLMDGTISDPAVTIIPEGR